MKVATRQKGKMPPVIDPRKENRNLKIYHSPCRLFRVRGVNDLSLRTRSSCSLIALAVCTNAQHTSTIALNLYRQKWKKIVLGNA